jgi:hypothetical protein
MRCHCGSRRFVPLGVQESEGVKNKELKGKEIYLINCVQCGTSLSCSKRFYNIVKYLASSRQVQDLYDDLYRLAHQH